MREINGFPFSETTASAFFSLQNLNLLLPRVTVRSSPFTLSSYALVNPSIGRAGNKGDT